MPTTRRHSLLAHAALVPRIAEEALTMLLVRDPLVHFIAASDYEITVIAERHSTAT
jgi:hypothetical protein